MAGVALLPTLARVPTDGLIQIVRPQHATKLAGTVEIVLVLTLAHAQRSGKGTPVARPCVIRPASMAGNVLLQTLASAPMTGRHMTVRSLSVRKGRLWPTLPIEPTPVVLHTRGKRMSRASGMNGAAKQTVLIVTKPNGCLQ